MEENWNREKASMNELKKPLKFWLHTSLHVNRAPGTLPFHSRLLADWNSVQIRPCGSHVWHCPLRKPRPLCAYDPLKHLLKKFSFYIEYQLTKATHNNYYTMTVCKSSRSTQVKGEIRKSSGKHKIKRSWHIDRHTIFNWFVLGN